MTRMMQTTASPIAIRLTSPTIVVRGARIPLRYVIPRNMALESSSIEICTELLRRGSESFTVSKYRDRLEYQDTSIFAAQ